MEPLAHAHHHCPWHILAAGWARGNPGRFAFRRSFAIAVFYSLGTLVGGVGAPLLFGFLIASGSRTHVGVGYLVGGLLMLAGAVCEYFIGIEAAGKSLETISSPLQSVK